MSHISRAPQVNYGRPGSQHRGLALGVLALVGTLGVHAADAKAEDELISESIQVLDALATTPDDGIPAYILERAEAIVVIPTLVRGGFVVGAEHGKGIMSVRDRDTKQWNGPSFVIMTGGSIGWQIGVQSVDLVLVVTNRDGVDDLLKSEFTLGANASVAAGPVGRSAEAATDARAAAKILAYSRAKGLFAGATIDGSSLRADADANERFYGERITPAEIFVEGADRGPESASQWRDYLGRIMAAAQRHVHARPARTAGAL